MELRDYIEQLGRRFDAARLSFSHGTAVAYDEAAHLVYGCLGIDYGLDVNEANRTLLDTELDLLEERAQQRIESAVPVAYLLGKAWFAGYEFLCDKRALVPRSPIAELIGNHFTGLLQQDPVTVLDLCCGGGCIGIATALEYPATAVDLVDVSEDALALARENVVLHDLESRVSVFASDLFAEIENRYDLILCNPPYVSVEEFEALPAEFKHEPELGLVSEDSGLEIPLRILDEAEKYLNEDGLLIMEVGFSAESLQQRLPQIPFLWLEFNEGGEGVFALRAEQLKK